MRRTYFHLYTHTVVGSAEKIPVKLLRHKLVLALNRHNYPKTRRSTIKYGKQWQSCVTLLH